MFWQVPPLTGCYLHSQLEDAVLMGAHLLCHPYCNAHNESYCPPKHICSQILVCVQMHLPGLGGFFIFIHIPFHCGILFYGKVHFYITNYQTETSPLFFCVPVSFCLQRSRSCFQRADGPYVRRTEWLCSTSNI